MTNRRDFLQTTIGAAIMGSTAFQQAWAQSGLPIEQVKVLYGFPPGSSGDICARRVAEKFGGTAYSKNAGVIDSRPGAGGQIALNLLKSAPADGSVLAMTPFSPISLYPHIFKNLQYKPFEDFTPVGTSSMIHHGFAVGPMVPASVKNVKDFVVWAKANPRSSQLWLSCRRFYPSLHWCFAGLESELRIQTRTLPRFCTGRDRCGRRPNCLHVHTPWRLHCQPQSRQNAHFGNLWQNTFTLCARCGHLCRARFP